VRDKVLSTTDCQQGLSLAYLRGVMIKTKSTTLSPSEGRQGFEDKDYHVRHPPTPPSVTHCCQTLKIHEGRSDYPMSPRQPKFCVIRSNRLPMRPVTPEGPERSCIKVCRFLYSNTKIGWQLAGHKGYVNRPGSVPSESEDCRFILLTHSLL
jgi:hypothetical protein